MSGRQVLSDYFTEQAEWRERKAEEHSEDTRNARAARGLRDLAAYVTDLPDDDPRLAVIGSVNIDVTGGWMDTLMAGEESSRMASRFRFDDPREDLDRFLTHFVATFEREAIESLLPESMAEAGRDLDGSDDPATLLRAVRYVSDNIEDVEREATHKAREAGWTWDRIASYLGRSRQAIWRKHA